MVTVLSALACLIVMVIAACGGGGGRSDVDTETLLPDGWEALRGDYSPDGEHLAFLGNRTDPSSSDGRLVVVFGRRERDLTPDEATVEGYGWLPNSQSLLISTSDGGADGSMLVIVGVDGKTAEPVPIREPLLTVGRVALLPDGRRAIIATQAPSTAEEYTDLYELNLLTGDLKRLTDTPGTIEEEPVVIDERNIAFAGGKLTGDFGGPNGWIGVLHLPTGEVRRLTPEDQTAGTPTVSPDGKTIVYDAFPGNERSQRALWRVPVAGGEPERIVERDVQYPAFRRDGSSVVGQVEGTGRLEVIPLPR